ncbi:AAA family ATPase [Sphaerisporangium sp. TRM90804]|uniref:ATP-binding protein n=1 Tax=Sphaerisporangium sp. TRM90804 TaxID=3031113 RepID=UPI002448D7FC|nr:AAA family ATPase [Sphaerisporangium sp. TRM90804]MDH2424908.1 LuxR family transcriptional regulator [Sphaerisporangium sp. TRM90804]
MPAEARAGNLPAEVTRFFGREREVAEVVRALAESRIVTLTGVGGVGKTRLAVRVARDLQPSYPDGVWFVELWPVRAPEMLGDALCAAMGVVRQPGRASIAVAAERLARRRSLVVLDTFEHLVDGCAETVDTLLRAVPGLWVLVTSRRALGLRGETRVLVEPLPVEGRHRGAEPVAVADCFAEGQEADGRAGARVGPAGADEGREGAVALFADRAASLLPGFVPTPEVATLCRRLDGIPLAIELAASRLRTLTVEELVGRVDDRFGLLSAGTPTEAPRHRTLRTAIGWSHELCEPLERLLWARLSVFAGDFDLDAAHAVCADVGTGADLRREDVEGLLRGLADKSIVRRFDADGTVRFEILDTVREYGAAWLRELAQHVPTRRRHRDHYLDLARRFDAGWFGPDQVAWHARIRLELPNLRAALGFSLSNAAERVAGVELAGRLAYFWMACGYAAEGRRHLRRALSMTLVTAPGRARALWVSSWLADFQGDLREANDLATECLAESFSQRDRAAAGWAATCCATNGLHHGYVSESLALYERAERVHADGGDPGAGLASALTGQAYALARLGRWEEALSCLRRQRRLCDSSGDMWMLSSGDWVRSVIELGMGDVLAGDRFARASLRDKRLLHDTLGMAMAVLTLAEAAARLGDMVRAARLLGVGELVEQSFGLRLWMSGPDGVRVRTERRVRTAIGGPGFAAAFGEGRHLDLETAVSYALTGDPGPSRAAR